MNQELKEEEHKYVMKCEKCGGIDTIITIEESIIRFPCHPNKDGDGIEVDASNGKTIFGQIDHLECANCGEYYGDTDDVLELIIKKGETNE
tara:strand:+ start:167 stop:439 length:273 start_codon:yes stop_codon:yes gene_type:complete